MTDLTMDQAKSFFGSLYSDSMAPGLDDFDTAAIKMVARFKQYVMTGDDALRLLMMNHILGDPKISKDDQVHLTAAVMGNIKRRAVAMFAEKFPSRDIGDLVRAAEEAGYKIEVLDDEAAKSVPRSAVRR